MSDETTKELLIEKVADLKEFIGARFENNRKEHKELNIKVTTTNGRVKKLEIWKAYLIGAWAVVSLGFPVLFVYFINDLKHDINSAIDQAIAEYDRETFIRE